MRAFSYERPTHLDAAIALLAEHGPDARPLAGGTDLIIRLRDGSLQPRFVVDVKRIDELDAEIRERDDHLVIGARTVMTQIAADERIRRDYQALAESAAVVGAVQIRNRATLAGNICNASPAADTAPALLVYGATVVATGLAGTRRIPIDEFFVRSGVTTLGRDELVCSIELPRPASRRGAVHVRRTRRRGHDLASVTLACAVNADGVTQLAYGSLGPRPLLVADDTGLLADPTAPDLAKAQRLESLFVGASPSARSMRASPEYRLAMLNVLGLRAVGIAIGRLAAGSAASMTARRIDMTVNGRPRSIEVAPHHTLLDVLRDDLGLTGTKECCLVGECGACTVLVNGSSVDSCLVLGVEADGTQVTTVEGLAIDGRLSSVQQAFLDSGAAQCGFCIPGQLISAQALLDEIPHPTRAEVEDGLAGNLCRCAGYEQIIEAVLAAAAGAVPSEITAGTSALGDRSATPDAGLAPQ